jgi:hypothetical protein
MRDFDTEVFVPDGIQRLGRYLSLLIEYVG